MSDVKIIAHRGANRRAPQNTMPAFEKAYELLADGFETDVHETKDGHIVICHNYSVAGTSNGKGNIRGMTLEELMQLDFGSYFSSDFMGTRMPTLADFLGFASGKNLSVLNIEIKSPKMRGTNLVRDTINMVKAYSLFDSLIISSFDPRVLTEAKDVDENCKTGFLYPTNRPRVCPPVFVPFAFTERCGCDAIHPMYNFVNKALVESAHRRGLKVNAWTVNDESVMRQLISDGVDGLITDVPDKAREVLDSVNCAQTAEV